MNSALWVKVDVRSRSRGPMTRAQSRHPTASGWIFAGFKMPLARFLLFHQPSNTLQVLKSLLLFCALSAVVLLLFLLWLALVQVSAGLEGACYGSL